MEKLLNCCPPSESQYSGRDVLAEETVPMHQRAGNFLAHPFTMAAEGIMVGAPAMFASISSIVGASGNPTDALGRIAVGSALWSGITGVGLGSLLFMVSSGVITCFPAEQIKPILYRPGSSSTYDLDDSIAEISGDSEPELPRNRLREIAHHPYTMCVGGLVFGASMLFLNLQPIVYASGNFTGPLQSVGVATTPWFLSLGGALLSSAGLVGGAISYNTQTIPRQYTTHQHYGNVTYQFIGSL